ncbi:MAG: hypothetical protein SGPRY_009040 [Prymnesium sp.]
MTSPEAIPDVEQIPANPAPEPLCTKPVVNTCAGTPRYDHSPSCPPTAATCVGTPRYLPPAAVGGTSSGRTSPCAEGGTSFGAAPTCESADLESHQPGTPRYGCSENETALLPTMMPALHPHNKEAEMIEQAGITVVGHLLVENEGDNGTAELDMVRLSVVDAEDAAVKLALEDTKAKLRHAMSMRTCCWQLNEQLGPKGMVSSHSSNLQCNRVSPTFGCLLFISTHLL